MKLQSCVHPLGAEKTNIAVYYMIISLPKCDAFYKGPVMKTATVTVVSLSFKNLFFTGGRNLNLDTVTSLNRVQTAPANLRAELP